MNHRTTLPRILLVVLMLVIVSNAGAQTTIRIASYNIQALGTQGSTQWSRGISVLSRVGADVVGIQEVTQNSEVGLFPVFSAAAGYPYRALGNTSGTLSGALRNGVLSMHPVVYFKSHSSADLSGDSQSNDITRDIFEAHIQVPGLSEVLGVFVIHLKASSGGTNRFRRTVELIRLAQAVNNFRSQNPNAPYAILGDFNEDVGDGPFSNSWTTEPSGLPQTYSLGNDISYPLSYAPFTQIMAQTSALMADATQEDTTNDYITRDASGRRLDYVLYSGDLTNNGDEVYNSVRDDGIDNFPIGNWLPKIGSPLPSSYSLEAADHFVVFGDFSAGTLAAAYPGSGEDFIFGTGINQSPSTGPGADIKSASASDLLHVNYASPQGAFDLTEPLVVAQIYSAGMTPFGSMAGLWVNVFGGFVILGGSPVNNGFQLLVAPNGGNTHMFQIPVGLGGSSVIFQALAISNQANNGVFAITDAHRIDMQ